MAQGTKPVQIWIYLKQCTLQDNKQKITHTGQLQQDFQYVDILFIYSCPCTAYSPGKKWEKDSFKWHRTHWTKIDQSRTQNPNGGKRKPAA